MYSLLYWKTLFSSNRAIASTLGLFFELEVLVSTLTRETRATTFCRNVGNSLRIFPDAVDC
jgi:hypothetical protein